MKLYIVCVLGYLTLLVTGDLSVNVKPHTWKTGYGQTVKFTCEVKGDEEYEVYWYKGQNPVMDGNWLWTDYNYLYIYWVLETYAGEYTCLVNNSVANAQDTATLKVVDAIITGSTVDKHITSDGWGEVILPCTLGGVNTDQVKWVSRYGQEIDTDSNTSPDPRFSLVTSGDSDINLQIDDPRTSDSGEYMCMSKTSPQQVQIISLTRLGVPEVKNNRFKDVVGVIEGNNIMLDCLVTGNPEPSVTWFKQPYETFALFGGFNEDYMEPVYETDNIVILANNSLSIIYVSKTVQAAYQCKAVNSLGSDNGGYGVTVNTMPTVKVSPHQSSAKLGETVSFECLTTGGPIELTWHKDGSEEAVQRGYNTLKLDSVGSKDAGTYTCKAEGYAGIAEDYVTLTIPDTDSTLEMLNLLKEILEEQRTNNRKMEEVMDNMVAKMNRILEN